MDKLVLSKRKESKIRVFIAADLSLGAKRELCKFIETLRAKRWLVRWESEDKLHITLYFIGWVEAFRKNEIIEAVERGLVGIKSLSIKMGRMGAFPDFVQPRVIWLGIKGEQDKLVRLQKQIARELVACGFDREKRGWIPHLTIGRVKNEARFRSRKELGRQLGKLEIKEFKEETLVKSVSIYQSILGGEGSVFNKIREIPIAS